jgi:hypothetical protein
MKPQRFLPIAILASTSVTAFAQTPSDLPPFPPDAPADWVCAESPPPVTPAQIAAWCAAHPKRGERATFASPPAEMSDLDAKNRFDFSLRTFLRERRYRSLGWISDRDWRLTGPYAGAFPDGKSYGVHPAVRVWYSPEVTDWLCGGRSGELRDGAMIVKEMRSIDPQALDLDTNAQCLVIRKPAAQIEPGSWTVMVKRNGATHDGWYWANPTASGEGNPPILTSSAVTDPAFFGPDPKRPANNPCWYPTGDLFTNTACEQPGKPPSQKLADVVTPYSLFGAYCMNCHASAEKELTFASLDNVLTSGLLYRHFGEPAIAKTATGLAGVLNQRDPGFDDRSGAEHDDAHNTEAGAAKLRDAQRQAWKFSQPLSQPAPQFAAAFGTLGPTDFASAWRFHLPAESFDHRTAGAQKPGLFLTSDQCQGCHDATVSNDATPNMLINDPETGNAINVSMYSEWRASPMGLAGRDPVFFSQLQSETNRLPQLTECIENTCLHCHGVMGQRQLAMDTQKADARCKDLFAIAPPPQVPFGDPFRLGLVTRYQAADDPNGYGNLARDGISCAVCHHIDKTALGTQASFTGNWVAGPEEKLFGPFDDVIVDPMKNALGITPEHGEQIKSSDLCGSCHNILLPVLDNDGKPHPVNVPGGGTVTSTYEQTTHLEWTNSVFARGATFQSCQDCHMPSHYKSLSLAGTKIANIESDDFAPTTHRLPDEAITLTPRQDYVRHSLHGLNVFLNEMFQQFPLLLGVRQIDYMGASTTQPGLITAAESMLRMAQHETADIAIKYLRRSGDQLAATVRVTNRTGHYLPSGVGFRRVFVEFVAEDANGRPLWASGRTDALGFLLDGVSDRRLATENGVAQRNFQPHYERITQGDQVQIYQELIKDSAGYLTTSFLRRVHPVKDNRLRPRGFDPKVFLANPSPYIRLLGEVEGEAANDPYYTDPALTGADEVQYEIRLPPAELARVVRVRATLYSQSIPPFYLQQRFADAKAGPAQSSEIQRLYYLTSHLNTAQGARIENWKLPLVTTAIPLR